MSNYLTTLCLLFIGTFTFGQSSDEFIPKDAVTVLSINNITLLKKISMDELVQYEFMSEVQSELFDGSTHNKTLKESGIDFEQKLNVFYGQNQDYEVAGFSFGILDKKRLFDVFDDFERQATDIPGIELYSSYFNHLIIKGNIGMVLRVDPTYEKISSMTDSIWMARGFGYFYDGGDNPYTEDPDGFLEEEEQVKNNEELFEEEVMEESDTTQLPMDEFDIMNKNYWEMRDSITNELQFTYFNRIFDEIYVKNIHLKNQDAKFSEQLLHDSDGIFYMDNSRNFKNARGLWYFQTMFPELFTDLQELYTGNVILGDIVLNENSVDIYFDANYGPALGTIYQKLNGAKFDKKVLNYIHENSSGFFTYNINLKEGYNQAYDIIIPILIQEKDPRISSNVLMMELINEYVNTDAVFDTYKGSMFGSFNGIKKVKTKKIEFFYDEETFEYGEREIEGEEEMPIFTMGFSTNRSDIPDKVLSHFGRMTSRFRNMGTYWIVEDAIFNSIPMYIINKNGLLIFTNDEDLAKNHSDGYGSESLKGKRAAAAKKSKFMYAYFDWGLALSKMPKDMFSAKQNEILDAMRGKTGVIELTSSETSKEKTSFTISYKFEGEYDNSGKYLLDMVNTVFVLSK